MSHLSIFTERVLFLYSRQNNYFSVPNIIYLFILLFQLEKWGKKVHTKSFHVNLFFFIQEIYKFSITPTRPWLTKYKLNLNADQNPPHVRIPEPSFLSIPISLPLDYLCKFNHQRRRGGEGGCTLQATLRHDNSAMKKKKENCLPNHIFNQE